MTDHIPQADYDKILSLMPIVCVDCVIEYNGKILVVRRKHEPAAGQWWIPGGRLYKDETLENCAIRKALEEVGLHCKIVNQISTNATIFDTVHSVNVVYLMSAFNNDVVVDDTILDHRWVSQVDGSWHIYVKQAVMKGILSAW